MDVFFRRRILLLIGVLFFFSCKKIEKINIPDLLEEESSILKGDFDFLPSTTTGAVYRHKTFTLSYSEEYEQAEWVAYVLKKTDIKEVEYKRPYFEMDDKVITGSAHWKNYKKSGYNKGHLCPAGDRRGTRDTFEETFLTSNISPQKYEFNSGIWNRLEQKVRYWAQRQDSLYVITGGVLTPDLETIGFENVAVPKFFYKVLLSGDRKNMIGFLVPHEKTEEALYQFIVPVDKIEDLTGIDFFSALPDNLESKLESKKDYSGWKF